MSTTVMVLEDEAIPRMFLSSVVGRLPDVTILQAKNATQALSIAEKEPPDIVVADIRMPGERDGIDVVRELHQRKSTLVIFCSAFSEGEMADRIKGLRVIGWLSKPIDDAALEKLLAQGQGLVKFKQPGSEPEPDYLLDMVYETARIGMCVTDDKGNFVRVNRAYCETYGYSPEELIGNHFTMVLPERDRAYGARVHDRFVAESIHEIPGEWQVEAKDGSIHDIYVTAGRMVAGSGRVYKVTTVTDITEEKRQSQKLMDALAQRDVLMNELNHRIKNNLNVLSSVLTMRLEATDGNPEAREIILDTISRVHTMSEVYALLQQAGGKEVLLRDYLEGLTNKLIDTLGGVAAVSIKLDVESLPCDIDRAINVGLIVNELMINAIKHAFPQGAEGEFRISARKEGEHVALNVSDTGVGLPDDFDLGSQNSLGAQLLLAVSRQLDGTIELIDRGSAHFRLRFPLSAS